MKQKEKKNIKVVFADRKNKGNICVSSIQDDKKNYFFS